MIYKVFLTCTLGLILFSCTNRLEVVSIGEIEIIRTSRDSTYFKDGSLFTGQIIKIVDDKELLSFSVNRVKLMDNISNITQAVQKNISNYKNGILDGRIH